MLSTASPNPVRPLPDFASPLQARQRAASLLRPPRRQTVARSAEQVRRLNNTGGGYVGPWRNADVPYMVQPMERLTDRLYESVVYVGAAQSAKTDALIVNWLAHCAVNDPADMMVVSPTQGAARDFSRRRIDRLHRDSPQVGQRLGTRNTDDNIFDKTYRGMMLALSWPSITELSGRPIPRVALTDYDRMPDDVDGEGSPFDLAKKRPETFGSAGKVLAESSPGKPLPPEALGWTCPTGSHEAPPAPGILALYNRGTRNRWYWPCPACNDFFEGTFASLRWDEKAPDPATAAASVFMVCPHGCIIDPSRKATMNAAGRWLAEGQTIDSRGIVRGAGRRSSIDSYWHKGPAAAFSTWHKLVANYVTARAEFEKTGDEEGLKTTINVDQAEAYLPAALQVRAGDLTPETLQARAEGYAVGHVPAGARFLVASVDIGARSFIVQVSAIGPGGESWIIDRYSIFVSKRVDANGDALPVDPGTFVEDWALLEEAVILRTYPLAADPARRLRITLTVVDSAGQEGVTERAYNFWRAMRDKGHANRVRLVKGEDGGDKRPRVVENYPDSQRKDRHAGARGEIPVLIVNVDRLKDMLHADLRRPVPGPGYLHLAKDLPEEVFKELLSEVRDGKGWVRKPGQRAETLDLEVYRRAGALRLGVERIDWERPPPFALPFDENPNIVVPVAAPAAAASPASSPAERRSGQSIAKLLA